MCCEREYDELEPIVMAFIDSFRPDEVLNIGDKSFNANQLRVEVRERSQIGLRIIEMVRRDNAFNGRSHRTRETI